MNPLKLLQTSIWPLDMEYPLDINPRLIFNRKQREYINKSKNILLMKLIQIKSVLAVLLKSYLISDYHILFSQIGRRGASFDLQIGEYLSFGKWICIILQIYNLLYLSNGYHFPHRWTL